MPEPDIEGDAVAALDTPSAATGGVDHLCCGNMGRVEALWIGAHRMDSSAHAETALMIAGHIRARLMREHSYRCARICPTRCSTRVSTEALQGSATNGST